MRHLRKPMCTLGRDEGRARASVRAWLLLVSLHAVKPSNVNPSQYLATQVSPPQYSAASTWADHRHLSNFEALRRAAADTWEYLPTHFNSSFKNPCWVTHEDGHLHCLPYFQILGVSKCGTTDLYHRLAQHPDVVDCKWKGPHFWDEAPYPTRRAKDPTKYDGSFQAYVAIFDKPAQLIALDPARRITGEASSNTFTAVLTYLRGPIRAKQLGTPVTLAQYLWEAAPWSRFVVMMRDPVMRYYSAYFYYRSKRSGPGTPQDFHQRAVKDTAAWATCLKAQGEAACLARYQPQQLVKGLYAGYLPAWWAVWPRERLLLLRTEDYKAAPQEHLQAVSHFLGLRALSDSEAVRVVAAKRRNAKSYAAMLPETRDMLQDFYRPWNERLSRMLGNDSRWLWGYGVPEVVNGRRAAD
ncbi:P-loop containing nucleoside triphosphate hydrolase protein [Haematococcus lacustris]